MQLSLSRLILGMLLLLALYGCGSTTGTSISPIPTAPTAKPTSGGNVTATHGTPLLGGPLSDFYGKFGQPNDHTDLASGAFHWLRDGSTATDGLIVYEHLGSHGYTTQVSSITLQAINGQIWDSSMATDLCTIYSPPDAHQVKRILNAPGQADGFDVVYVSASLGSLFPPGAFLDSDQNPVQPGTFVIQYLYKGDGTQHIDSCTLIIGDQLTQG